MKRRQEIINKFKIVLVIFIFTNNHLIKKHSFYHY